MDPRGAHLDLLGGELGGVDPPADSGPAFDDGEVEGVVGGSVELVRRREAGHSGSDDHDSRFLRHECRCVWYGEMEKRERESWKCGEGMREGEGE